MKFAEFLINEAPMGMPGMPPPGGAMGGLPTPGGPPGMGGGLPPAPPGGPPGMGGLGGGMGGMPGQPQQPQQQPTEIKTKDVWSLLEKLLSGESPADSKNGEESPSKGPSDPSSYIGLRT